MPPGRRISRCYLLAAVIVGGSVLALRMTRTLKVSLTEFGSGLAPPTICGLRFTTGRRRRYR